MNENTRYKIKKLRLKNQFSFFWLPQSVSFVKVICIMEKSPSRQLINLSWKPPQLKNYHKLSSKNHIGETDTVTDKSFKPNKLEQPNIKWICLNNAVFFHWIKMKNRPIRCWFMSGLNCGQNSLIDYVRYGLILKQIRELFCFSFPTQLPIRLLDLNSIFCNNCMRISTFWSGVSSPPWRQMSPDNQV